MPVVRTVILAAGSGSRFGGQKLLASLDGRPVLRHVVDALADAGVQDPVVVLGRDAEVVAAAVGLPDEARIVVNPEPGRGLSSSVRLGWTEAHGQETERVEAVLFVLGDQPRVRPSVIEAILEAPLDAERPIVAPRYAGGGGRNPVRLERSAAALLPRISGDRGLGPLLDERPELVRTIEVPGTNPDIDRPSDLEALAGGPAEPPTRGTRP